MRAREWEAPPAQLPLKAVLNPIPQEEAVRAAPGQPEETIAQSA